MNQLRKQVIYLLICCLPFCFLLPPVYAYAKEEPDEAKEEYKIKQICLGDSHTAAITTDGQLYMWGDNTYGQLGNGDISQYKNCVPVKVLDNVVSVGLGRKHSGAVTSDGKLYMWGDNDSGQLGNGSFGRGTNSTVPILIMENVQKVVLGELHSAAITTDGSLYVWGANLNGCLGTGSSGNKYSPVKIMENVVDVSLGWYHSAAITSDGSLYIWGYNNYGQLGKGTSGVNDYCNVPEKIMDDVVSVSLGYYSSASVTSDGTLYTWGDNRYGQLGLEAVPTSEYRPSPQKVMENVRKVSLGSLHCGAVTNDGYLYMWGDNGYDGKLGIGTSGSGQYSAVPVKILENVADISFGYTHSAALKLNQYLYMWGANWYGELGDGTTQNKVRPVKIRIPGGIVPQDEEKVRLFVRRLYTTVLGRIPDQEGIDTWTALLMGRMTDGLSIGYGFTFSDECLNRKLSNDDYVEILYKAFLDRSSDTDGKNEWVSQLAAGVDREKVFYSFVMSDEFEGICRQYGIEIGQIEDIDNFDTILNRYRNQSPNITKFVARCYLTALERTYDFIGLENWCREIITKNMTPKQVAECFIFSEEFEEKKLDNVEYVKALYRSFMGREADADGLVLWVNALDKQEMTRSEVLDGFAYSEEFSAILESFYLY